MKIKRQTPWNLPPALLIVAGVLVSPLAVLYACTSYSLRQRRLRAAAQRQLCPSCGRDLGVAAVQAADKHFAALRAEQFRSNPGVRLRLAERVVHAICTACGTQLQFVAATNGFTPV